MHRLRLASVAALALAGCFTATEDDFGTSAQTTTSAATTTAQNTSTTAQTTSTTNSTATANTSTSAFGTSGTGATSSGFGDATGTLGTGTTGATTISGNTGTTSGCGCQSNADCASFGPAAYCQNGGCYISSPDASTVTGGGCGFGDATTSTGSVGTVGPSTSGTGGDFGSTSGTTGASSCIELTAGDFTSDGSGNFLSTTTPNLGAAPDELVLQFFGADGGSYASTGTFSLSAGVDSNYATCDECVLLGEGALASGSWTTTFFQSGGTITISSIDVSAGELVATLSDVSLVEVSLDTTTWFSTPVPGGACAHIASASINLPATP